jgi:WD40 repeat protein/serine/threonine protein kinase
MSTSGSGNYVLLTRLADEFAARYRAGERPALEEYLDRYPHLADEIRELFPAMVELEQGKEDHEEAGEQAAPATPPVQQLGDFRILREVGKGGMGIVYEAEQVSLGRHVALKVLPKTLLIDARAKRRFEREAKAAAKLHHTNIVPVFGVGEQDGLPYYVMQFIQGLGLDEVLDELKKLQPGNARSGSVPAGELRVSRKELSAVHVARSLLTGEFVCKEDNPAAEAASPIADTVCPENPGAESARAPALSDSFTLSSSSVVLPGRNREGSKAKHKKATYWQSVARVGVQVAGALEYAHKQGVQHRDIKPSNLLLDTQGTVWVTDFGLAKAEGAENLTHTGDILGTLRYMPPEAFEGRSNARSDVYSLGLTLYELLAFRPAFAEKERHRLIKQVTQEEPARLGKLNRQVPQDLETIVHRAIDKDPQQRYASAGALAEDLQRFIDDEPIRARRVSQTERLRRWCRRNPVVAGLMAAVFVLVAAVAVVASVAYVQTSLALRREAGERAEAQRERGRAESNLYHSLVREAQALRRLRDSGYRRKVWDRLQQALALETPDKDVTQLRQEAVACMGDFVGLEPTTWPDTPSYIAALEVHPDARQVAIGLEDGTILLRDLANGAEIGQLHEHHDPVLSLSVAADGKRMASADRTGLVKVWEMNSSGGWACTRTILLDDPLAKPDVKAPHSVVATITPDGQFLLAAHSLSRPTVVLWNLTRGTRLAMLDLPGPGHLDCLAWSPDGKLLAAGYYRTDERQERRLLVWKVADRTLLHNLASEIGAINDVAFSTNGNFLAYAGHEGGAVVALPKLQTINLVRFGLAGSVHFSPEDKLVAFTEEQAGAIRLWDLATNREAAVLNLSGARFVRFNKDGQALLAASGRTVQIWNLSSAQEKIVLKKHVGGVPSVAFSPDGKLVASAGKDRTVRIWEPATGRLVRELTGFRGEVETVAFSPDGSLLATGDWSGAIRLWRLPSWEEERFPLHPLGLIIWACAFSPDGRFFAACGEGGVILWKVDAAGASGRADAAPVFQQMARPSKSMIGSLSFSPDGNLLAWVSWYGGRIHLWDVSNARPYPFPPVATWCPRNVAFYRDGRHLAFIRQGRVPEVWDVVTRQRVYPADPDDFREASDRELAAVIALSPDDAWLAAQMRRSATLWDMRTRKLLLALPEGGFIWGLAWSPKRELLATSSSDGSLVLWNIPGIRALLAEIGLDWQDPPLPAAGPKPAEPTGVPPSLEPARLFALEEFETARATLTTEGNVCRVEVTTVDGMDWHVRLVREFDHLEEGATYTVRFRAKADAPRPMTLRGEIHEPDWHAIGLDRAVPLTEAWQSYAYDFQAKDLGHENGIHFHLGDQTGTVWIADFTLTRGGQ